MWDKQAHFSWQLVLMQSYFFAIFIFYLFGHGAPKVASYFNGMIQ